MADTSLDIKMQHLKLSDSPVPALVPDHTPAETYTTVFEATTPPLEPSSPMDTMGRDAEAEVEELLEYDTSSLKSADVKTDPILANLARKQAGSRSGSQADKPRPSSVVFKARPAPSSTRQDGLGPRMTKSAALRQGLDWTGSPSNRTETGVPNSKESPHHVPGQRRETPKTVSSQPADGHNQLKRGMTAIASSFSSCSFNRTTIDQILYSAIRYRSLLFTCLATEEGLRRTSTRQ